MEFVLSIYGIIFLLMNGSFVAFLLRFAEKMIDDPEYEEKLFRKTIFNKTSGNSKKNKTRLDSSFRKYRNPNNK